jgi:hypothetical protein
MGKTADIGIRSEKFLLHCIMKYALSVDSGKLA